MEFNSIFDLQLKSNWKQIRQIDIDYIVDRAFIINKFPFLFFNLST